jgi:hypothetical protein
MTTDEQNDLDIMRMMKKRLSAVKLIEDYRQWHLPEAGSMGVSGQIIYTGLIRDALRGTEEEVDRLTVDLEERNHRAFMKKLEKGLV